MKKNINKVQISVHKALYKGHSGEKLRPEIYSAQEQLIAWLALNSCHWLRGQQGLGVPSYLGLNWSQEGKVVLLPLASLPVSMHGFLSA